MKKSIYSTSQKIALLELPGLQDLVHQFEVVSAEQMSLAEAIQKKIQIIEVQSHEFEVVQTHVKAIDWKTHHIRLVDVLQLMPNGMYHALHLVPDCLLQILKEKSFFGQSQTTAMIIGSYEFVLGMSVKMALSGFSQLVVSLSDSKKNQELAQRLKECVFQVQITFVPLAELTQVQQTSSILISNVSEKMNAEAYESLMYFNFLSEGAIFVDCCSLENQSLVSEARRAGLKVIEETDIMRVKYQTLLK